MKNIQKIDNKNISHILIIFLLIIISILHLTLDSPPQGKTRVFFNERGFDSPVTKIQIADFDGVNTPFWASGYQLVRGRPNRIYFWIDYQKREAKELIGVDVSTFKILHSKMGLPEVISYAEDKNGIWCNNLLQKNIDSKTFTLFPNTSYYERRYAWDKNNFYINCKKDNRFDPKTFEVINSDFTRDKNGFYYKDTHLNIGDQKSFIVIGDYVYNQEHDDLYDLKNQKPIGKTSYAFNKNSTGEIKFATKILEITDGLKTSTTSTEKWNYMTFQSSTFNGSSTSLVSLVPIFSPNAKILLYKNRMFFSYPEKKWGSIGIFDFAKNSTEIIDLTSNLETARKEPVGINSYSVRGSNLYLLTGTNGCNEYMGNCKSDLYLYNLDTKTMKLVSENVSMDRILGLSTDGKRIALVSHWGDAGLWSSQYMIIDLITKVRTEQSYGGDYYEDDSQVQEKTEGKKQLEFANILESDFINNQKENSRLLIQNGVVVIPTTNDNNSADIRYKYIVDDDL